MNILTEQIFIYTNKKFNTKMAQWIGFTVSIKCVDDMGTYQGEIVTATNSEIVLTKAFCNGFPCERNEITIK